MPSLPPTATAEATAIVTPEPAVCSPLAGYALPDLASMIVNPYLPPRLGSDDPHQGMDLGVLDAVQGYALAGNPVQAVLAGKVAGVTADRFPYGNMLMIETPLEASFPVIPPLLVLPTPLPARLPRGALTCPELNSLPAAADAPRSLYILYAHMLNSPAVKVGDPVGCGQEVGAIGQSGNALNPHIHVEVRVGPANQKFTSMAHYDPSADYEEMAAYCLWRVSGVYQTIDPGCLWGSCATP
jgi:murein DD-endopeptidase MepM/ murein hydrolase activator NlpD